MASIFISIENLLKDVGNQVEPKRVHEKPSRLLYKWTVSEVNVKHAFISSTKLSVIIAETLFWKDITLQELEHKSTRLMW